MELLKRTGAERTARRALQALALLAAFACAASAVPWGAARGSTSYKHLVLPSTARSAALAGGGVSWTRNGLGPVQPASSPRGPLRLSFDRAWMPEEVGARLDRIALERGAGRNGFSLAATILDYDDINGYTDDDAPAGSYGAGAWHVSFGWSRALGAAEWGMRLSGGRYAIEDESSWAATGDFGLAVALPFGLRAGTALRNVGWATKFLRDEPSLPTELVAGLSHHGRLESGFLSWSAGCDVRRRNGDGLAAVVSGELVFRDRFALRAGWPFGEDEPGITAGVGFLGTWVDVDYALVSDGLYGMRHHLGLAILL